jgi:mycothiol synthase
VAGATGPTGSGERVERADRLTAEQVAEVLALAEVAAAADGTEQLSESVVLAVRHGGTDGVHLIGRDPDGALAGYAHLAPGGAGSELELVVHPLRRRRGLGRALAAAATAAAPAGPLLAWAHGDHPSAAALALDLGCQPARELWQLRRPLSMDAAPSAGNLPPGVSLRAFRPGEDDEAWLALNRLAFADHPEQGRWTADDLRLRLAEPWFDPAGFLLAVQEATGRLLGFHWTKVHPAAGATPATGEVYVLGVDPDTHGLGLGRALTDAGLRHLRERGLDRVMLYVDATNTAAVALYRRLGFARWCTHAQYRRD